MENENVKLVEPAESYREEFIAYCEEFKAANEPIVHGQLPQAIEDFPGLVKLWADNGRGVNLPEGYVPCSVYWLVRGGRILGCVRFRHRLNEDLTCEGGNIGYEVRPCERRKGYATRMLELVLDKVRTMGLTKVLITCDKDNIGSAKVIQNCGGVLENEVVSKRSGKVVQRYWIDL